MPAPRLADPFYSVVDPSPFYRRRGKGYVLGPNERLPAALGLE